MEITVEQVKQLREATGAGVMDCREALRQSGGDFQQAVALLREKGLARASQKAERSASDGIIGAYVHHNSRVAVLVEVNSETDFVARTPDFGELAQALAMHIAMANPRFLQPEDIPADELAAARVDFRQEAEAAGKPAGVVERIVEASWRSFTTRCACCVSRTSGMTKCGSAT